MQRAQCLVQACKGTATEESGQTLQWAAGLQDRSLGGEALADLPPGAPHHPAKWRTMSQDAHSCMLHVEIYMRAVSEADLALPVLSCKPVVQVLPYLVGLQDQSSKWLSQRYALAAMHKDFLVEGSVSLDM